ncbi:hypothetical protein TUM17382_35970 [Shewanella algae]|nr:hypothetical protein TUM17382_35970 [Shewanella algae]
MFQAGKREIVGRQLFYLIYVLGQTRCVLRLHLLLAQLKGKAHSRERSAYFVGDGMG